MTKPRDDLMALATNHTEVLWRKAQEARMTRNNGLAEQYADEARQWEDAIRAASRSEPVDREAVARLIVGPRLPVPSWSQFTLEQLQKVRWDSTPTAEQKNALNAADAILSLFRPAEPVEPTLERLK